MIIRVTKPAYPDRVMMQRAGYTEFRDPNTGETSYIRRLGTHFYPRWHVYLEARRDHLQINLHLDQKQPSYPGFRKHSGEYDGAMVEGEAERISQVFS